MPAQRIDRLVVLGVRDDLDPRRQRRSAWAPSCRRTPTPTGPRFLPQGSPTNNTDTDRTAWSRGVPAGRPPPPTGVAPPDGSNAAVLAPGPRRRPDPVSPGLDHALDAEQPAAQAMQTALWATTWEVVLGKLTHPATPGRSFTPRSSRDAPARPRHPLRARAAARSRRCASAASPTASCPPRRFAPNGYAPVLGRHPGRRPVGLPAQRSPAVGARASPTSPR